MDCGFVLLMVFFTFLIGVVIGLFAPIVAVHIYRTMKFNFELGELDMEDNKEDDDARKNR